MSAEKKIRVAIIGGGAAGFFAAAHLSADLPGADIVIFEQSAKPLAKVKISGGGRCNVTNACFDPKILTGFYPRGAKELRGPFSRFGPAETIEWFRARGVTLVAEADGRMFPSTNRSQTIIDALMSVCEENGVRVLTNTPVEAITAKAEGRFHFTISAGGDEYETDNVLVATGSSLKMWRLLEEAGIQIIPPVPSLFALRCEDTSIGELAGISVPRAVVAFDEPGRGESATGDASGPLLITHRGFSGPAVLAFSARNARELHSAQYRFPLRLNWTGIKTSDAENVITRARAEHPAKFAGQSPLFSLSARLWLFLLQRAGIGPNERWSSVSNQRVGELARAITAAEFTINGKDTNKDEFVTCGGVALPQINFRTMECKQFPGLYFAGEVLDIDALTGGFNFQAAWTTAWIAAESIINVQLKM